ncbi:MAG: isoprenylcysteine carboxylmethyltransferase family protein [Candidatus Eisenbacteria bacterium]|uniref:Isoprenylcysteine carboxylmethyltransferase family protein n=1 Tax=Eiseniibacteriota bacterium TaxID=2212470 RepID=A0A948W7I0_UNCEI|nr:isoprenylcysteine carboxylmethyltransferase family protein [Candidatus Eisenbacteria bacterium]MBU2692260.1 isoprenylcysteine carboxylmethyltransferase family protein [Candidatus Eisenbacteria bacterium]
METIAYYLALVCVMAVPAALASWFVLHLLAPWLRRAGPIAVRAATVAVILAVMGAVFLIRQPVLRQHFGVQVPLVGVAVIFFGVSSYLRTRILRQIPMRMMLDLPKMAGQDAGKLITGGIYSRMRHPGYVAMAFAVAAAALFTNYLAMYVVALAYMPLIGLVAVLDERELATRFPGEYRAYCARVPRFIPRFSASGRHGGKDAP